MSRFRSLWLCLGTLSVAAMVLLPAAWAAPEVAAAADDSADSALMALADDYFDKYYFPTNPTAATTAGVHRFDDRLEDYSRSELQRQLQVLHRYERRFEAVNPGRLSERVRGDRELLLSNVRSTLLTLETIKPWQKDPGLYVDGITNAVYVIMQREFATAGERLALIIARERLMPSVLREARANLVNPPRIYTEIALEQLPGVLQFFQTELPAAFVAVRNDDLQRQLTAVNARVVAALQDYQTWLRDTMLARSHGDFRIGAQAFRAKLADDEMVDTPLDRLLDIGMADLRRNQASFASVAHQLDPDKSVVQVLAQLSVDHPAPAQLLDAVRADFGALQTFIIKHQIITLPSLLLPIVRETPAFMRATTFASMDTPGPFEPTANEAYFNVTLPEADWDAQRVAGFMAEFNYPLISNVVVHEAYPGHYVQFLWMHRVDDRVRKLLGANTNSEGWAHYCEQMMLDEGYGQPDAPGGDQRPALLLRLGQLQDALLRDARYIVGIKLHTGQMSFDQAVNFFVDQGYESRDVGLVETKRGTSDPTYLYYTLGKLQILKLRADLQARQGASFSLLQFHDAFMQQGFPPIKLVRRALLQDDSPTL